MRPIQLLPKYVERVWGSTHLDPWFPDARVSATSNAPIGEVWLSSNDVETSAGESLGRVMEQTGILGSEVKPAPGGRFPILLKFLFTSQKLSVQVHPDDAFGLEREGQPGKTEMWVVLRADQQATIAQGFRRELEPIELRRAVYEGNVEELLEWWPCRAGQFYFTPAGTVHAIGAGLAICEIQQNSDVTYRLWDYGRNRELHIDKSLEVTQLGPAEGPLNSESFCEGGELLLSCEYFATERYRLRDRVNWSSDSERFHLLVVCDGRGRLECDGQVSMLRPGQAWLIPAALGGYSISADRELNLLRIYVPSR